MKIHPPIENTHIWLDIINAWTSAKYTPVPFFAGLESTGRMSGRMRAWRGRTPLNLKQRMRKQQQRRPCG